MRALVLLLLGPALWAAPVVKTVCASGCDYSDLQAAIHDAERGWILELKAGENFDTSTSFELPFKSGTGWITLRSSRISELPAGKRVSPSDGDKMPKIRTSGTEYDAVIRTSGAPSSYWRLEGLEITLAGGGLSNMGNLVQLGDTTTETSPEKVSHHFVIDRCYIHGLPFDEGPWRGILHNADHVEITNNYLSEIKLLGSTAESHVLAGWSFNGPLTVRNNFVSGGAINSLVGGAAPAYGGEYPLFLRYTGNHYQKPGTHQVIRYEADPEGTVLPARGALGGSTPARSQTFWKTDTEEFYVYQGSKWYRLDGVTSGRVCLEGSFWRNESATPAYWECVNGNWQAAAGDRTATGIGGAFNGWGIKNLWEFKGATGGWLEGNLLENTWYPTFGNQKGASILLNWLPQQGRPASTIRDVTIRDNRMRRSAQGVSTGVILVYQAVSSAVTGSPTTLVCSGGHSMPSSGSRSVVISGATGEWAGINGRWVATMSNSTTFSIPYNSAGFGPLTGAVRVQDETIAMAHLWPNRFRIENNLWESLGEAGNITMADCCASTASSSNDGGYAYSTIIGMPAQIGFPGMTFNHNTFHKPHNGRTYKVGSGINVYDGPTALGAQKLRDIQWMNNIEEAGELNVYGEGGQSGCDSAITPYWTSPALLNNVVPQIGQYAYVSGYTGYYDSVCPTWAWPWKRSGSGVKANVTAAQVTADATHCSGAGGNRLTLTLDAGHGLFPNTKFTVSGATPSDINGTYSVPGERYSTGLLPSQTNTTLEVCTAAPIQSYSGAVVEASAGFTDHANGNFRLAAGSQYQGFATDGSDPGVNQDIVDWATATAESGEHNPYLDMGVKTFIPSPDGGEFRFTAYSNAACAWRISSTRAFADSLGSVSQTRAGRYGEAAVSGLNPHTRYWYKLTCDGKYRDGEMITR